MAEPLHIALVGTGFMGRAHSNAWMSVNGFFDPPRAAVRSAVCGADFAATRRFAERWGWERPVRRLQEVLDDPRIDLVDVCTPNHLHAEQSIAALQAGKHVACEKPLARTLEEATAMRDAARRAAQRGGRTFVWFNYRRCPAVAFARRLVAEGALGRIYHVRAGYLQDWGGPETPMSWRFDSALAGAGAHGDLGAHAVDLARFVTGREIEEVCGAVEARFIDERPGPQGPRAAAGRSTVDDCTLFLARFAGGAVASFEATRVATGNANRNFFEINGSGGSVRFDFSRMNELEWFDGSAPGGRRGWTTIPCTTPGEHPYIDAYWPPGHPIGYEHQFISQASDIIREIAGASPVIEGPDFEDAWLTQRVLHAAQVSARERRPVSVAEVGA